MPRAGDPRVSVRFSAEDFADVERAARVGGLATCALIRECAVQYCALLVANRAAARVSGDSVARLRGRSGVRAVTPQGPGRSS